MPRTAARRIEKEFTPAANGPEGQVISFGKEPNAPKPRLTGEALRLDQFRRQSEELARNLAARPQRIEATDLPKANQTIVPVRETQAAQAAAQEKGGSVFSLAYDGRFFGIV